MKITIEGASEDFAEKVLALAAQQGADLTIRTVETGWTVERAERYLRSLTAGARTFAQLVVDGDGRAEVTVLRAQVGKLQGPTVALSRAVPRGVKMGWWPEGTPAPIEKVNDPNHPSWDKPIAYVMSRENVAVFREAFARLDRAPARLNWGDEDAPSALAPHPSWGEAADVPRVILTFPEENGR